MKKNIYRLLLCAIAVICFASCNEEWKDEQYKHMVSFKANVNGQGVTMTYVRYRPGGVVRYNLPILVSGSTLNGKNLNVKIALDPDTLATLNKDEYGHRKELYFQQLPEKYYDMPETLEVPAGQNTALLPIDFKLNGDLDQAEKWLLPLQIVQDPSLGYEANPRQYYRRAMLRLMPFNDYSGSYDASQYLIYFKSDVDETEPFTISSQRAFVVDERTIFIYAGTRDIDYLDRRLYKIYIRFPEAGSESKALEVWSDNPEINFGPYVDKDGNSAYQSNFNTYWEMDELKPYLKKVFITMNLFYEFDDYTTVPGQRLRYKVKGSLSMQRNLNTLIPDEDQQIEW